jgi:16S rRNA (cytidine1402-2'-O)-methyltransferase
MLYIVATPIGNLQDMSFRAVETLKSADLIACEDTRHTGILLAAYQIRTPTESYHSYSSRSKESRLLALLAEGKRIALVSDAGMPGISDPGVALIRGAIERGIEIEVVPGPSASLAALALSGFATDRFIFEGFLPVKPGARRKRLEALVDEERTAVLYESPHRILKLLEEVETVFGDVRVSVSRELTKKFEETRRGPVAEIRAHFAAHPPKGEFAVVLPPKRERAGA